ncbi:MAG: hypothetical protein ABGZ24_15585, partial [Fuerstiella sp.]
ARLMCLWLSWHENGQKEGEGNYKDGKRVGLHAEWYENGKKEGEGNVKDGKPAYTYNFLGLEQFTVAGKDAVPEGAATVVLDFAYDGDGLGKGGKATLSVNGKTVAEGRIGKTQPLIFSADETADVGLDNQTPVVEGIGIGPDETRFTGTIDKVTIAVK